MSGNVFGYDVGCGGVWTFGRFVRVVSLSPPHPALLPSSAVLSSHVLGETLNVHGKIGCFLCITGSTVIIVHAPEETDVTNLMDIGRNMISVGEFAFHVCICLCVCVCMSCLCVHVFVCVCMWC